ncbi:hypothetical protein RRG08_039284 [Elysia crispata]|uniref:Uncharacterized protein n=1 Tax=Elysia crispata TaxID=231223 RepID=A0AAE0Z8Z1_9GAST|nr:hypothetical protein RRG08_039284 [Elysia crispata]
METGEGRTDYVMRIRQMGLETGGGIHRLNCTCFVDDKWKAGNSHIMTRHEPSRRRKALVFSTFLYNKEGEMLPRWTVRVVVVLMFLVVPHSSGQRGQWSSRSVDNVEMGSGRERFPRVRSKRG